MLTVRTEREKEGLDSEISPFEKEKILPGSGSDGICRNGCYGSCNRSDSSVSACGLRRI